jgi:hypothetical protein
VAFRILVVTVVLAGAIAIALVYLHTKYDATFGIPRDTFTPLLTVLASLFGLLIAVTAALTAFVVQGGFNAWYTNTANLQRLGDSLKRSSANSELSEYPQAVHAIQQLLTMSEAPTVVGRSSVYDWHKLFPEVLTALRHVSADLKTKAGSLDTQAHDLELTHPDVDVLAASTSTMRRQRDALVELVDHLYAISNSRAALDGVALHMETARLLVFSIKVFAVLLVCTLGTLIFLNLEIPGKTISNHTRFDFATLFFYSLIMSLSGLTETVRTHLDTIKLTHIPYGELD